MKPGNRTGIDRKLVNEFLDHELPDFDTLSYPASRSQAEYVNANEGGCLSYQLSLAEDDPDGLVIFERSVGCCHTGQRSYHGCAVGYCN